jgi:hypothetical protein
MLYPPKNRAYSPEAKKTKDLTSLMNINSKFTGSGGSKKPIYVDTSSLAPKKHLSVPKPSVSGIFKADKFVVLKVENWDSQHSFENIMIAEIFPLLSAF